MAEEFLYRLNPAYCMYKGIAIEEQSGSKISFVVSSKDVRKTVKKGFYEYVDYVRSLQECPPEYSARPKIKFKFRTKNEVEKRLAAQMKTIYTQIQLEILEKIFNEKKGLIIIATEAESKQYEKLLHFDLMNQFVENKIVVEKWQEDKKDFIKNALNENYLVFVEMKKSNVSQIIAELLKDDFFTEDFLYENLKGIILQDTHDFMDREDLLSDIAILKSKKPLKHLNYMSEDEQDECFVHYTNFGNVLKNGRKRLTAFAMLFCLVFSGFANFNWRNKINDKIDSKDWSVPYQISGELDYSNLELNLNYWFFNNNDKNIRSFTIVFYLFDEDGNPPVSTRSNIVLNQNMFVEGYANISKRIRLDYLFETLPDQEYTLDYMYVSKIEFADGTEWSDPFGMKYLN